MLTRSYSLSYSPSRPRWSYHAVGLGDVFGRRPRVDLGQQLLDPPQDAHFQRFVVPGHQPRPVPAGFERRDRLRRLRRRRVHVPVLDARRPVLGPQPLHVAPGARLQLRVAASEILGGRGVRVRMREGRG